MNLQENNKNQINVSEDSNTEEKVEKSSQKVADSNNTEKKGKPKKRYKKPIKLQTLMVATAMIAIFVVLMMQAFQQAAPAKSSLGFNEFMEKVEAGEVKSASIIKNEETFKVTLNNGEQYNVTSPNVEGFRRELLEAGVNIEVSQRSLDDAILSALGTLPMLIVMILLVYYVMKTLNSQATTLFKVLKPSEIITFDNVAGMSETKREVEFAVTQIKNAKALEKLGTRPCKGIILEGPPGTGKTLLAKAIAGEAGVPFISTSGADFIEMFVGLGAARVRALWELALANAPCVVFIDEIDAVGRRRSGGTDGASVESNQTLNALLQRMDGLGVGSGVFIVAATNRIEDLDPALLRPGRFDKHLYIGPPKTKKDRDEVINVHMRGKQFANDFEFDKASKLMFGLTGAEIEQVLNESVMVSLQNGREGIVSVSDIDEAAMKLRAQGVSVKHSSDSDRLICAVHESGHAIVGLALGRNISKVSILPYSSGVGGLTIEDTDDKEDKKMKTRNELMNDIQVLLAGRAAEKLILGDTSIGCSNDIERATILAFNIVNNFAMSDDNLLNLTALSKVGINLFDTKDIIEKMNKILKDCQAEVDDILTKHKNTLLKLKDRLLDEETVMDLDHEILGSD